MDCQSAHLCADTVSSTPEAKATIVLKVASRWMIGLIAMPMLVSCAGMGPQAPCPDIGGTYADRAQGDKGSLVSVLTGQKTAPAGTVELTVDAAALHVETSKTRHTLRSPADFSCSLGNELTLTRQDIERVHLPPLIDQSVVTSYRFRKTATGDLQMDVYFQTTASPYGWRLSGPEKLDRTLTWTTQSRR